MQTVPIAELTKEQAVTWLTLNDPQGFYGKEPAYMDTEEIREAIRDNLRDFGTDSQRGAFKIALDNINCLSGMLCPTCKSVGPYEITGTATFTVTDDGTDDYKNVEWDTFDNCACNTCGFTGTVIDFTKALKQYEEVPRTEVEKLHAQGVQIEYTFDTNDSVNLPASHKPGSGGWIKFNIHDNYFPEGKYRRPVP